MRSLALVAVVVAVGCTSTVENKPPAPHACASTFAGTWTLVNTALGGGACGAPERVEMTITIDDALSRINESYPDGATNELTAGPTSQPCDTLSASRVESLTAGTQLTNFVLLTNPSKPTPGQLSGTTEITLYEPSDFEANKVAATPICKVIYDSVLSR